MSIATRPLVHAVAILVVLTFGYGRAQAESNLVSNGGFESGAFGPSWGTYQGTSSFTVDSANPHSGVYGANFYNGNYAGSANLAQVLATTVGQDYVLDFFVAVTDSLVQPGDSYKISIYFNKGVTQYADIGTITLAPNAGYVEYSFTVQAANANTNLVFVINLNQQAQTNHIYLDDIRVDAIPSAVPEPSSLALCVIAGLIYLIVARVFRVVRKSRSHFRYS